MISARSEPAFDSLATRLAAKAKALAEAHIAQRDDPHRWRRAHLLWPLFARR